MSKTTRRDALTQVMLGVMAARFPDIEVPSEPIDNTVWVFRHPPGIPQKSRDALIESVIEFQDRVLRPTEKVLILPSGMSLEAVPKSILENLLGSK